MTRYRYGNNTVKLVRQFEKRYHKFRKLLLDLSVLENCVKINVRPKFMQFRVADRDLRDHMHTDNVYIRTT